MSECEIGAGQTGQVLVVDDDGTVSEECTRAFECGGVEIEVGGLKYINGDVAMFTG